MQGDMAMSDFVEVIHVSTMTCKVFKNGELVESYKVEQCDNTKCKLIRRLDSGGYLIGEGGEKVMWLCGNCR
jgi:hypothetical protein